ncbi:MAG: methylated-DNA--[protein]-cysteine S-methyltransferase [Parachlamydiaceae bacterium]|nr:MAG: methylated-DNA--[protein]-cysteine S-methyltransferase [Parachlamydiaceae bacterium]
MDFYFKEIASPIGKLKLIANDLVLVAILMETEAPDRIKLNLRKEDSQHPLLIKAEKQLKEYFDREREAFDLSLEPIGTSFQKEVWDALKTIPYGKTLSYSQIAEKIKRPKAIRAVGTAIGKNPLSIVVPCHRVIGANGQLRGFAGGLDIKAKLLNLEKPV